MGELANSSMLCYFAPCCGFEGKVDKNATRLYFGRNTNHGEAVSFIFK